MTCMHRDDSDQPANLPSLFVCVEVLRPSQQLWSCRAGQLPINTVPGQVQTLTKRLTST